MWLFFFYMLLFVEFSFLIVYDCIYDFELVNDFGLCFSNKIKDIWIKLVSESRDNKIDFIVFDKLFDGLFLVNFDFRFFDEVLKIL